MRAAEAGRQGCGVVGDDQVAGAEQAFPARCAADGACGRPPSTVSKLGRPPVGIVGGDHARTPAWRASAGRQRGEHRFDDLGGRVLRALQCRAVGIRNRQRMQRRIHVAGVDREETTPSALASSAQIAVRWRKRCLAGAIGAPAGIGVDGRVAGNVDHQRAAPVASGCGKRAEQRLGQAECADQIDRQRLLQLLRIRCRQAAPAAPGRGSRHC